jgi:serine/threonine protein kinase
MTYECPNERLKDFVTNIKLYFNQKENQVIYDKRNIIKVVEFEGKKYVVKSFKTPHLLNQIVYRFFRDSKAKRSFQNSIQLRRLDIHTPEPVGYIEIPTPFRFKESFYISDLFNFDFEIRAVFVDENFEDRENILKQFIEYTHKLHKKKVYHIDYSPGNILVRKIGSTYLFSIIDVNRMKFIELDNELRMKSISKLTKSEKDNQLMVQHYAKISKLDEVELQKALNSALKEEAKYLANKKRLKKIKG